MPPGLADSEVLAWFAAYPPVSHVGMTRYGQALQRVGQIDKALHLIRETWIEANFTKVEEAGYRQLFELHITRQDEIDRLERLLWAGRSDAARRQARRLGDGYPELAEARLRLAQNRGGVDSAIEAVPEVLQNDPGLVYERARWRMRRGRYDDTLDLLDPPMPGAPHPDAWWNLRYWVARDAYERGDLSVAYRLASLHGAESGIAFAEGEFFAGWLALRFLRQPEQAYRHFQRLYEGVSYPISLSRAAYWAGEAANAIGEPDWARRWYELAANHMTTFYGQMAAARLGIAPMTAGPRGDALEANPADALAFERNELVQAARAIHAVGETDRIVPFLIRLQNDALTPGESRLVSSLAYELDRADLGIRSAKQALYSGMELPVQLYPDANFFIAGGDLGALIQAVIRQESVFFERAISHAGARGLMQLMPATARSLASRLGEGYSQSALTSDPAYNVRLGTAYLEELIKTFDGFLPMVAAAYNAGPSRVREWITLFGDPRSGEVDPIDWLESIPFDETRNYVQRVMEGLVVYRDRQTPGAAELPVLPVKRDPSYCCETAAAR